MKNITRRRFKDIPQAEVGEALKEFLDKLRIAGPVCSKYDLYSAVYGEHFKAQGKDVIPSVNDRILENLQEKDYPEFKGDVSAKKCFDYLWNEAEIDGYNKCVNEIYELIKSSK